MGSWLDEDLLNNVFQHPDIPVPPQAPSHAMPELDDSDWDTTLVVTDEWLKVASERRHSGWESVERRWIENQQAYQPVAPKPPSEPTKEACEAMARFPYPHMSISMPQLEFDFRMRVILNPQSASVAVSDGFKKWSTFSDGSWAGRFGHGVVVSGGQESQDLVHGKTAATQVESTHKLQTEDEVPAYIECKTRGNMTGPPELMKALQDPDPDSSQEVDPRLCPFRVFITMKTQDERYASKLNTGMWVGSCLWKGLEVVYDAYRLS